jgi:hypothetical protein
MEEQSSISVITLLRGEKVYPLIKGENLSISKINFWDHKDLNEHDLVHLTKSDQSKIEIK